jgi:hypothetical protein
MLAYRYFVISLNQTVICSSVQVYRGVGRTDRIVLQYGPVLSINYTFVTVYT